MQQYYDYLISQETFQDSIKCYSFTVRMKEDLQKKEEEQILIRELVSYFDKKTFNVMYRKYVMSYRNWIIELDVSVEVYMDYVEGKLVPSYIHYNGFGTFLLQNQNMPISKCGTIILSHKKSSYIPSFTFVYFIN